MRDSQDILKVPSNLKEAPKPIGQIADYQGATFVRADLHANLLNLLHFLVNIGVVNPLSNDSYEKIEVAYASSVTICGLTGENISGLSNNNIAALRAHYKVISDELDQLIFNNKNEIAIDFLGDMLADRGLNDVFILLLLKKLKENGIPFKIKLSNHDVAFLRAIQKIQKGNCSWTDIKNGQDVEDINPSQLISLRALALSIEQGFIKEQEVMDILDNCYYPNLELVSVQQPHTEEQYAVNMHAPVNVVNIADAAKFFKVDSGFDNFPGCLSEVKNLNRLTHIINAMIKKIMSDRELASQFIEKIELATWGSIEASANDKTHFGAKNPIPVFIWNRELPTPGGEEQLVFVHGHVGEAGSLASNQYINLDCNLGKIYDAKYYGALESTVPLYVTKGEMALEDSLDNVYIEALVNKFLNSTPCTKKNVRKQAANNQWYLLFFKKIADKTFDGKVEKNVRIQFSNNFIDACYDLDFFSGLFQKDGLDKEVVCYIKQFNNCMEGKGKLQNPVFNLIQQQLVIAYFHLYCIQEAMAGSQEAKSLLDQTPPNAEIYQALQPILDEMLQLGDTHVNLRDNLFDLYQEMLLSAFKDRFRKSMSPAELSDKSNCYHVLAEDTQKLVKTVREQKNLSSDQVRSYRKKFCSAPKRIALRAMKVLDEALVIAASTIVGVTVGSVSIPTGPFALVVMVASAIGAYAIFKKVTNKVEHKIETSNFFKSIQFHHKVSKLCDELDDVAKNTPAVEA